jgi:hypothetical protein
LRTVEDDHVDRPDVEAQQCAKLTGTNRSIGLIALIINVHPTLIFERQRAWGLPHPRQQQRAWGLPHSRQQKPMCSITLCPSPAWWLWRGVHTRSHLELGRKSPQRQWYFVSRRGRVGRRQACERQTKSLQTHHPKANQTAAKQKCKTAVLAFLHPSPPGEGDDQNQCHSETYGYEAEGEGHPEAGGHLAESHRRKNAWRGGQ